MSHQFYGIRIFDNGLDLWYYAKRNEKQRPVVRDCYKRFVCKKCHILDELPAFQSGIPNNFVVPQTAPDWFVSDDDVNIVSSKAKSLLEMAAGKYCIFQELRDSDGYWSMRPSVIIKPPPEARHCNPIAPPLPGEAFQIRSKACRVCGRFSSVTFQSESYQVESSVVFAGIEIHHSFTAILALVVNEDLAAAIAGAKLAGIKVVENAFAN